MSAKRIWQQLLALIQSVFTVKANNPKVVTFKSKKVTPRKLKIPATNVQTVRSGQQPVEEDILVD